MTSGLGADGAGRLRASVPADADVGGPIDLTPTVQRADHQGPVADDCDHGLRLDETTRGVNARRLHRVHRRRPMERHAMRFGQPVGQHGQGVTALDP